MQQINPVSVFTAPTMVQLGRRVLFGVGLTSLVLMVFWLWFTWGTVQRSQFQRMSVGGTLIAGHFENYLNFVGADLDRLGDDLTRAKALQNPSQALSILNEFKRRHPDVVGATVILPDGQIAASTELDKNASPPNVLANPDWREDFYNNLKASGLSVNRTQLSYLTHKWIIPIRYTVRDSRGRVVFLLQTAIFVDRQQNLWRNLKFAENAAVGLLRTDGYLISRYSAVAKATSENYQGKVGGALFQAIQKNADAGTYMGTTVDGSTRYGYYQRLKHYPLYAFLSYPKSTFIAMWWQGVRLPVFMILGVLFASIVLYRVLAGRFARRMRFVQQSMQDTGVSLATPCSSGVSEIDQLNYPRQSRGLTG